MPRLGWSGQTGEQTDRLLRRNTCNTVHAYEPQVGTRVCAGRSVKQDVWREGRLVWHGIIVRHEK
jgi:hypothetical protein